LFKETSVGLVLGVELELSIGFSFKSKHSFLESEYCAAYAVPVSDVCAKLAIGKGLEMEAFWHPELKAIKVLEVVNRLNRNQL